MRCFNYVHVIYLHNLETPRVEVLLLSLLLEHVRCFNYLHVINLHNLEMPCVEVGCTLAAVLRILLTDNSLTRDHESHSDIVTIAI